MGDAVLVVTLAGSRESTSYTQSVLQLTAYDAINYQRVLRGGGPMTLPATPMTLEARRNQAVKFLLDESQADWLLFIDSDMGFMPDALDRLLEVADPEKMPVVGALCFGLQLVEPDEMGGFITRPYPTIYDWRANDKGEHGLTIRWDYPTDTVVRCAATGAAFLLIHRDVLLKIRAEFGDTWFDRAANEKREKFGEDFSFCLRCAQLGIPIHVHTGVKTTHLKEIWVSEPYYMSARLQASLAEPPPPATDPVAVIVPVLRRPQNAAPFMRSLRATTGLARAYAVVSLGDVETADAWRAAGAEIIQCDGVGFACKANAGYRNTVEPWLFITGDDVRFHPGWYDHAVAVARDDAHVIGTNDLGNPRVMSGQHATHMLIRRSYVDEVGASWDGPGVVAHEGYHHWYVDDEIVHAAKQRKAWRMALASIVEHLHPYCGKTETDDVYALGQRHAAEDQALFRQRLQASMEAVMAGAR